ncbi:S41 family peptidase [Pseudidiomarina salilacus]|uniref:S41 family peptidase n=1 Tax=Pseudidiomarina salilacus TaxID=3384452 RepID=UPI0039847664
MNPLKAFLISTVLFMSGCAQSHLDIFPELKDPSLMERKISVAELHQDIDAYVAGVRARHPDFERYADEQALQQRVLELKQHIDQPLTRVEFFRYVGQLSHLFNDGHSFLLWPYHEYGAAVAAKQQPFPFAVKEQDGALYLARGYDQTVVKNTQSLPVGSQIVSINGIAAEQIIAQAQLYVGGETQRLRDAFVAERFPFMLWAVFGMLGEFELELRHDAQVFTVNITSEQQWQSQTVQAVDQDLDLQILQPGLAYLRVGSFDVEPEQFAADIATHFAAIKQQNIQHLIIDIRDNTGGNTDTATELASYLADAPFKLVSQVTERLNEDNRGWFGYKGSVGDIIVTPWTDEVKPKSEAKRFTGNVYVLIGPVTYSAAIVFATTVQDNRMGTLVGEPTGGYANQTAQGNLFNLPHSQLRAYVATRLLVRPNGATAVTSVVPDIWVQPDMASGSDTALTKIKELVQ